MEGSSAALTIRPPLVPVIAALMKGSAATFRPTCFMLAMALFPA